MKSSVRNLPGRKLAVFLIMIVLLGSCNLPADRDGGGSIDAPAANPTQTQLSTGEPALDPTQDPDPAPTPGYNLPEGYRDYSDGLAGITISIPESWAVTGVREGKFAILQSYPEGKYIGGEPREAGDTKCDLNLDPDLSGPEDLKAAWENSGITTLLAESTFTLAGGGTAIRYEIDSMGRANLVLADLEGRLVTLTCFGELDAFDPIAATLRIIPE